MPLPLGFLKRQRMTPSFLHTHCLQGLRGLGHANPAISTEARRNPRPFHRQPGPEPGRHLGFAAAGLSMPRGCLRRCPGHFQFLDARETPWQCLAPTCPPTPREEPRAPAIGALGAENQGKGADCPQHPHPPHRPLSAEPGTTALPCLGLWANTRSPCITEVRTHPDSFSILAA